MIEITNIETFGWASAVRGMRNPMNSWEKSDSGDPCKRCQWGDCAVCEEGWRVGPNDFDLMTRLVNSGPDHRKFMRQIFVSMDIKAPLYWWKEMDQYKVGTTTNSCSTMHKITAKQFELDDFSHDHLSETSKTCLIDMISHLNCRRDDYLSAGNETFKKECWYDIIQLLPSSYNQLRTWTADYEVLRNIYNARRNHKLHEWRYFCDILRQMPYANGLLFDEP